MEHGFQRGTDDADILVCKSDRSHWLEIVGIEKHGDMELYERIIRLLT